MAAPICRICEIEPMMGVDYSCTLTHSLSGFRSMKQNRNKERQRATEQFEVKYIYLDIYCLLFWFLRRKMLYVCSYSFVV